MKNIDKSVVAGFGDEWTRFDQSTLPKEEQQKIFDAYFSVFPWKDLPVNAVGFDAGCGSGRWAELCAPRCGKLNIIDASEEALAVARKKLHGFPNISIFHASVEEIPLEDGSQDFGYSLGVLHHVPDTKSAIRACVKKLKLNAPFLVYLYYRFDNRPLWFRLIWQVSDVIRSGVSRMPHFLRYFISQVFAGVIYWPLARLSLLFEKLGVSVSNLPLSSYRDKSFYTMRTDALDRFGTRLEQRFTRAEIQNMMVGAGLKNVTFNEGWPFWCAVGYREK